MIKEIEKKLLDYQTSPASNLNFLNKKKERTVKLFQTDRTSSTDSSEGVPFEPFEIMKSIKSSRPKPCNCKNSQCLKKYCECFAGMSFCDPKVCSCIGCSNNYENIPIRNEKIQIYTKKLQGALKKLTPQKLKEKTSRCCTCKKSNCQKNYCECYQNNMSCGPSCKCVQCKNLQYENVSLSKSSTRTASLNCLEETNPNRIFFQEIQQTNFRQSQLNKKIAPIKLIINNYTIEENNLINPENLNQNNQKNQK